MIASLGSQANTRSVIQPKSAFLRLFYRNLQPLTSPQAFNTLVIDHPPRTSKQGRDPAIAVTSVLPGQFDHVGDPSVFIGTTCGNMALGRTVLSQNTTGTAFGNAKLVDQCTGDDVRGLEVSLGGLGQYLLVQC